MTPRAAPPEADQPRRQQQQQEQQGQPDAALTEKQVAAALQCDCVKELREGPCGEGFVQGTGCDVATCGRAAMPTPPQRLHSYSQALAV